MSSFTFCDSLILCVISLFALFILWRIRFFKPGAKIKNKFLDKQMSYGLKCEMIIKKLSSPNYPPPIFVIVIVVLWAWSSALSLCCKLFFESILRCICLEYCGIFIFFAYNE